MQLNHSGGKLVRVAFLRAMMHKAHSAGMVYASQIASDMAHGKPAPTIEQLEAARREFIRTTLTEEQTDVFAKESNV